MSGIEAKAFDEPDETVTFEHGHVDLVKVGSLVVGREVLQPGWRWSTHVKPIAGTEWCEFHHVAFLVSGRFGAVTRDGETREVSAGTMYDIAPGHDTWVLGDEPAVSIDFQGVVGWAKPSQPGERILTTILFTDIVGSTAAAERLGDRAWRRLLAAHAEDVRSLFALYHGREVKTTGDGFLATFDTPARAIHCALAISAASKKLGSEIRAGVHTGEVELRGDDLGGIAVSIGARVMGEADPGEVLVSSTVKDLVVGSGIRFASRGAFELKGVPGQWALFAVEGT